MLMFYLYIYLVLHLIIINNNNNKKFKKKKVLKSFWDFEIQTYHLIQVNRKKYEKKDILGESKEIGKELSAMQRK